MPHDEQEPSSAGNNIGASCKPAQPQGGDTAEQPTQLLSRRRTLIGLVGSLAGFEVAQMMGRRNAAGATSVDQEGDNCPVPEPKDPLLRLSAELLNRINADPDFAERFDADMAGSLKELYPQLARVPKEKITNILEQHQLMIETIAKSLDDTGSGIGIAPVGGLLSLAGRLARTSVVQSLATSVAVEVVSRLLSVEEVPFPE